MNIMNPMFMNDRFSVIRFQIEENGRTTVYDLNIPDDPEVALQNKYYAAINQQYDLQELKDEFTTRLEEHRRRQEYQSTRQEVVEASKSLKELFELKVMMFEDYPFLSELSTEDQALLRRAPDKAMLMVVLGMLVTKYTESKQLSILDLYEEIEDHIFSKIAEEQ